ncbi:MAG TPA: hypothetical protein VM074_13410, partial [Solimonas sp.]|nr:hypothetical protein [Solimonas sp.]
WDELILTAPSMALFRQITFRRLIPNLEYIGLMSDRIKARYEQAGLTTFIGGRNATQLTADDLTDEKDLQAAADAAFKRQ